MRPLTALTFGFSDAENYKRRENRQLFEKIFLKTEDLDALCRPNVFFLIGEKGTGKTAYAVKLSNSDYNNSRAFHKYIQETDYLQFIALMIPHHQAGVHMAEAIVTSTEVAAVRALAQSMITAQQSEIQALEDIRAMLDASAATPAAIEHPHS